MNHNKVNMKFQSEKNCFNDISNYLIEEFDGLSPIDAWGERSYFYNPSLILPRGVYFCTLKEKDGDNDRASNIDREGVYRFNFGLPAKVFLELYGEKPKRPAKGRTISGEWDFTEINKLMPHPVYGWMNWVSILSPTEEVFTELRPYLHLSYEKAKIILKKRLSKK